MSAFVKGLALGLLVLAAPAHADTWRPPEPKTYASSDGTARVTITPRPLQSSLAYFKDAVDGKAAPGQREGSTQTSPLAKLERCIDGDWRTEWEVPLVNDVGPVHALVANDGRYLATFDNWHSAGFGDDVVAIYGAQGKLIRKFALEDILPASYIALLPRTVSSLWWGGDHALDERADELVLQVLEPASTPGRDPERSAPVRIRLSDGHVLPPEGAEWERTMATVRKLDAERDARWQQTRAVRARPLPIPTTTDTADWREYLVELRGRLSDAAGHRYGGLVLPMTEQEGTGIDSADGIRSFLDEFHDKTYRMTEHYVFVSPSSEALADLLVDVLKAEKPGAMGDATIAFVGTKAEGERVRKAAATSGARIELIDKDVPFPPRTLPDAVPEWFR